MALGGAVEPSAILFPPTGRQNPLETSQRRLQQLISGRSKCRLRGCNLHSEGRWTMGWPIAASGRSPDCTRHTRTWYWSIGPFTQAD